jgi:hypothetical protein
VVEVMTAVSLLSSDSVFLQPYRDEEKKKAGLAHRRFASREGDLLTLITIYEAWTKVCSEESACYLRYVFPPSFYSIQWRIVPTCI